MIFMFIFPQEWAKHTGKYRPGIDTPDFVHMKTRLRCAFNKAPDIEEVAGIQKVKNDIPYKIYRLLPHGCKFQRFSLSFVFFDYLFPLQSLLSEGYWFMISIDTPFF